jgi:hypothetical protein
MMNQTLTFPRPMDVILAERARQSNATVMVVRWPLSLHDLLRVEAMLQAAWRDGLPTQTTTHFDEGTYTVRVFDAYPVREDVARPVAGPELRDACPCCGWVAQRHAGGGGYTVYEPCACTPDEQYEAYWGLA